MFVYDSCSRVACTSRCLDQFPSLSGRGKDQLWSGAGRRRRRTLVITWCFTPSQKKKKSKRKEKKKKKKKKKKKETKTGSLHSWKPTQFWLIGVLLMKTNLIVFSVDTMIETRLLMG